MNCPERASSFFVKDHAGKCEDKKAKWIASWYCFEFCEIQSAREDEVLLCKTSSRISEGNSSLRGMERSGMTKQSTFRNSKKNKTLYQHNCIMVLFLGIEKSLLPFTVFPLFFVMGLEDKIFIKLRIIFLCIVFFENQKM